MAQKVEALGGVHAQVEEGAANFSAGERQLLRYTLEKKKKKNKKNLQQRTLP